jgi:protein transport protein SEC24
MIVFHRDQSAGRNVFIGEYCGSVSDRLLLTYIHFATETATGRTSWQPPTSATSPRPTHPQGQARMSMPPMAGPPAMRGPLAGIPGAPSMSQSPSGGSLANAAPQTPPQVGPGGGSSRRRAYPTAHLAANSVSFSGGFDPGAQAQYGDTGANAGMDNGSSQLFTPGIPKGPQQQTSGLQPSAQHYGHQHTPSAAPTTSAFSQNGMGAGSQGYSAMSGLSNQFAGMGVGGPGQMNAKGNPLYTVNLSASQPNVNDLERPPPEIKLPPDACVSTNPKANADPSYQRCTLNAIPTTSSLLNKSKVPLGLILSPYRSVREEDGDDPVPVVSDTVIARCRRCRTYINPFVKFIEGGQRWKCCMCNISNEVPQLFDWDQEKNQPADRWARPELNHGVVEFIAPREYMVSAALQDV